jgi:osmoprotectant transport system permease protein
MLRQIASFIAAPENHFLSQTLAYLALCLVPIVASILISIPLGILVAQNPTLAFAAANISGLARAIPTLAFLAIMLPVLGIGFVPSVVALTLLGIPPILLNTIAGLRGIDPAATEAGRGMGMTREQLLWRVRIPLVLPVVAAGVRTAAVQIVATAPLAALIGGGGYGDYILQGLDLAQTVPLIVGAGGVAILALIVEFALAGVQRAVTPVGIRERGQAAAPFEQGGASAAGEEEALAA